MTDTRPRNQPTRRHADHRLVQPGESMCPVCDQPGHALIDQRGVKLYHPRQGRLIIISCRADGHTFADLFTVPDEPLLTAFTAARPTVICPRCRHQRAAHILLDSERVAQQSAQRPSAAALYAPKHEHTWGCPCGCPGPGGVVSSR